LVEVVPVNRQSLYGVIECGEVNVTLAGIVKLARGLEISLVDLFLEFQEEWGDLIGR
jgi:hypothetical protein